MLDFKKKIVVVALSLTTAISSTIPTFASEMQNKEHMVSLEDFVNDSICTGLELCEYDYGNYSISNLIPVYNFETNEFCNYKTFVLSDESVVAEMNIWIDENNDYISSFSDEIDENIKMFINGTSSICYGIYNGRMWLCANNTDFYEVESNETINVDEKDDDFKTDMNIEYSIRDTNETKLNLVELKECKDLPVDVSVPSEIFEITDTIIFNGNDNGFSKAITNKDNNPENSSYAYNSLRSTTTNTSKILDVVHVGNVPKVPGTDPDLCWAACMAMKTNYINRNNTNYTVKDATSIYNYLVSEEMDTSGSVQCVKDAYAEFGISIGGGNVLVQNQKLWNTINADQPFELAIKGKRDDGREEYHQVLVYGMKIATTGLGYLINCPNKSTQNGKKVVSVSGKADDLLKDYLRTIPYTDTWSYEKIGRTISFNNVQRTYYTQTNNSN